MLEIILLIIVGIESAVIAFGLGMFISTKMIEKMEKKYETKRKEK